MINAKGVKYGTISAYADREPRERFAEAFHDVYLNGENADPLAREIVRIAKERYNDFSE